MSVVVRRGILVLIILAALRCWGGDYPTYSSIGSTYVPMDSWIYPAFDRLSGLGTIPTAFAAMRPWTRSECARLLTEVEDEEDLTDEVRPEIGPIVTALRREFRSEIDMDTQPSMRLESLYSRVGAVSGKPLTDGYHFGQTFTNDFGRPYASGVNTASGFSAAAEWGTVAAYFRGEYQRASAVPPYSQEVLRSIAAFDRTPISEGFGSSGIRRFRTLDGYVALNLHNTQISFGKQQFWWGPGRNGAMLLSDNAEPFYSLRVNRVMPLKLPGILGLLGPIRLDSFIGQLSGHRFIAPDTHTVISGRVDTQPYIHGQKFSFKPTPNLEIGFARTVLFGGSGVPFTARTLWRSVAASGNGVPGDDPGDRRSGFDFSYRVPGLRRRLVLYSDSLAEDEITPVLYPHRSAFNPGIYLPMLPGISRMDLRVEAGYTDPPPLRETGFFYSNLHYRSGYTNNGELLGSWIGRDGGGIGVSSTYWISPRDTILFAYHNGWADRRFLEGGHLNSLGITVDKFLSRQCEMRTMVQYEHWRYPLLDPKPQSDFTASFEIKWFPRWEIR